jgi:hypothetical protein
MVLKILPQLEWTNTKEKIICAHKGKLDSLLPVSIEPVCSVSGE